MCSTCEIFIWFDNLTYSITFPSNCKYLTVLINEVFIVPIYSDILKELRKDKGFTQADMGKMMGISQSSYSDYENGIRNMPLTMLDYLADALGTSTDYILGRTDEVRPYPKRKK